MDGVKRSICHACVSQPRDAFCNVCDSALAREAAERLRGDVAVADANDAERREAALREELAKVIEDRARFPDRPDFIGNMISAHIGNLKAKADSAERYSKTWSDRLAVAEQRNATLCDILVRTLPVVRMVGRQDHLCDYAMAGNIQAEIETTLNPKPTESGASE